MKILLVVLVMVFAFAAQPRPAYAFLGVGDITFNTTIGDIPARLADIFDRIRSAAGSRAYHQALRSVTYRLAQDSAVWLASGDRGQRPLIWQQPLGDALTDIGDQVAGKFLVNVSQGLPIDLCSPASVQSRLKLTIGISKSIQDVDLFGDITGSQRTPSRDLGKTGCSLSDISNNFQAAYKDPRNVYKNLSKGFDLNNNELGAYLVLRENVQKEKEKQIAQEKNERAKSDTKAVKDPITGQTTTPAGTVEEVQKSATRKAIEQEVVTTGDIIADAAAIFTNTFAQTYLRRLQQGLLRGGIAGRGPGGLGSTTTYTGKQGLINDFSEFSPKALTITSGSLSLISDMSVCPSAEDKGVYPSPYNCLLTPDMRQAVEQKLTVGQAVKQNLIPKDILFPEAYVANTQNFSPENLSRLRFLRVIPVGWELAAKRLSPPGERFERLLYCFEQQDNPDTPADESADHTLPSDCPKDASGDNALYHLVDPAWVLGLPQFQCNALAYGALPEYSGAPNRQSVCVDLASCIKEENGQCTGGYGYCTRERVTWNLSGTSCEPQYATCQSFSSPKKLSVLTAYVDNAGCSKETAGCKWYSTAKLTGTDTWDLSKKIYLNNKAQSCAASASDTYEVIPLVAGVNYVKNSGFDDKMFAERPSGLAGSIGSPSVPATSEGGWNFNGQAFADAYVAGAGAIAPVDAFQEIVLKPFTYYTLSFSAFANPTTSAVSGSVAIKTGSAVLANISFENGGYDTSVIANQLTLTIADVTQFDSSSRFAASFYNAASTATIIELHLTGTPPTAGLLYDNIQLEEIKLQQGADAIAATRIAATKNVATINAVPGNGSITVAAPTTAYAAYGSINRSVFANAGSCTAEETSARKYAPAKGGSPVYARLSAGGLCASQCLGFSTLLAMPTAIEKLVDANARAVQARFVPDLATSCTREQVGCEVFTNAQTEQREYYNRIESCVNDTNPNSATFFTWEAGQLKVWNLLRDTTNTPGKGLGPCTTFPQGARQGVVDPATTSCQDGGGGSPNCTGDATIDGKDVVCRTYVDENGTEYKRDSNKVVTASSQCAQFRRTTEVGGAQQSWYFIPSEANKCSAAALGCREYKGKRANVVTSLFTESFEQPLGTYQNTTQWDIPGVSLSTDTVNNTGASVQFGSRFQMNQAFISATTGHSFTGNAYELRFVAKGNSLGGVAITGAHLTTAGGGDEWFFRGQGSPNTQTGDPANIIAPQAWRNYTLGPLYWPRQEQPAFLRITVAGGTLNLDDLQLVQIPDTYYKLQSTTVSKTNGGKQPDACYAPTNPADPSSTITSCQQYRDDKNNTYYVSRFDKLFPSSQSLTCTAVIDTQNYDYPYSQAFNMGTTAIPVWNPVGADTISYRYIDSKNKTSAAAAGCTALGQPPAGTSVTAATVTDWSTAYKRVDPDEFLGASGTLCGQESLWCEAFTASKGGTQYFRDPGDKLCNWDPTAGPNGVGGFVKANGSGPCNTAGGDVPQCPQEANACTAYLPSDTTLSEGSTTALFRLSSKVSTGDCNGIADVSLGCVNFTKDYYTTDPVDPNPIPQSKLVSGASTGVFSVTQNRQCAEWLAPTTTSQAKQPTTRLARAITYDLGRCQKVENNICVKWVTPSDATAYPSAYTDGSVARVFDLAAYQNRYSIDGKKKTIYSGAWDYSGYSLPGQYPVELLREVPQSGKTVLAYNTGAQPAATALECRGYPEQDSPFNRPDSIQERIDISGRADYSQGITLSTNSPLKGLNLCEEKGIGCECSYKKAEAVGQTVWLSRSSTRALPEDTKQISSYDGWYGYCLEESPVLDPNGNKACIAWWPVDVVQGKPNVFENHPEAGFAPDTPLYYCLEAKGNQIADPAFHLAKVSVDNNVYSVSLGDDGLGSNNALVMDRYKSFKLNFEDPDASLPNLHRLIVFEGLLYDGTDVNKVSQGGWNNGYKSAFRVRVESPLSQLYEYDIDSIVLKVRKSEGSTWASVNQEFPVIREGSAFGPFGGVSTPDRWSVFWCGGKQNNNCGYTDTYSWTAFNPFFSGEKCASNTDGTLDGEKNTNIFGVRAIFADEKGGIENKEFNSRFTDGRAYNPYQFAGFEVGLCDNTSGDGKIDLLPIFNVREWCTDVAQVVDTAGNNKAWTGRVNNQPQVVYTPSLFSVVSGKGSFPGLYQTLNPDGSTAPIDFYYSQDNKPYGAIVPPPDAIYDPEQWDSRPNEIKDEFSGVIKVLEPGRQPIYVESPNGQVRAGSPYSCKSSGPGVKTCVLPPTPSGKVVAQNIDGPNGVHSLRELFTRIFGWWIWDPIKALYQKQTPVNGAVRGTGLDFTGTGDAGRCPVIQAAIQTEAGYIASSSAAILSPNLQLPGNCGTINNYGRYSINGSPVKHDVSGTPEETVTDIYVGQPVELAFYGYNYNGEQLPIKKITIDWVGKGLPEDITEITGNFKNHRADCGGTNYGQSARACENAPFVFTHVFKKPGPASPIVIIEDNWGKYTRASYNALPNTGATSLVPIMQIKHLNLSILPPENLAVSTALPSNNTAQPVQGDTLTFAWTIPAAQAGITRYEVTAKKNFSDGTSGVVPSSAPQPGLSFSIPGAANMKSLLFEVSTCTDDGCGAPASANVTFKPKPVTSVALNPSTLVVGVSAVISWAANTIADTYQIELDEKDGVPATSAVVTAPNLQWTYAYQPSTMHVNVHVRPCNGTVCGSYYDTGQLAYQEVIGIVSGTGQTSINTGSAFTRSITVNKTANYIYSFTPALPTWLSAAKSGSTITLSGTPTLSNVGTYSGTITVNHTIAPVSNATGAVSVVVNSTCGDGTLQTLAGEACDPAAIANNATIRRCTTQCAWEPDLDSDTYTGQTDCDNNDGNAYPGSTYKGTTQKDYNCNGTIESACASPQSDFACAAASNPIGPDCPGSRPNNPTGVVACPSPGTRAEADAFCRAWKGTGASSIWTPPCNSPYNEVGCGWCPSGQVYY